MDTSKRLVANSFFNFLIFAVELVLGLVLVPFIVHHLGKGGYGVWALISSVLAYSSLLMLGLNSSVNRWVPVHLVDRDFAGINRVVSTVLLAYTASAFVLLLATLALAYGFPSWFAVPSGMEADSQWAALFVGLGFVCFVQLSVFGGVLSGLERYDLWAMAEIAGGVSQIVGVVVTLSLGYGLVGLALVFACAQLVKSGLALVFSLRACPELRPRLSLARFQQFRDMLAYSLNTLLYASQLVIQRQMSLVMIGLMLTAPDVTDYAMPLLAVGVLTRFIHAVTAVVKPAVSRLEASDDLDLVREIYVGTSKLTLMLALPIGCVLAIHGDRLLRIWLGDATSPTQAAILAVLACSTVFAAWSGPAFFVVVGLGRHRLFGRAALGKALLATAVGFAGLALLGWGPLEVAYAFAVPEILISGLVLVPYCTRCVGLPIRKLWEQVIRPALLANLPFLAGMVLLHDLLRSTGTVGFLAGLVAVFALVGAGSWLLGLGPDEKRVLLRLIRRESR